MTTIQIEDNKIVNECIVEIPFFDVDSMHVVWHGRYVKYLEVARCELLEQLGYDYQVMRDSGFSWPITDMRIKYIAPLRFKQKICIRTTLIEWEHRIKINYVISDVKTGARLTKAYTTQMAIDMSTQETLFESPELLIHCVERAMSND